MWAILPHPDHAESFADHGEEYAPMRRLAASLSKQPYADAVYAFKSLITFVLTFAASYSEREGHDQITIRYSPGTGSFDVAYAEWVSPTRNPPHRIAATRSCSETDVLAVVDLYVLRLQTMDRQRQS